MLVSEKESLSDHAILVSTSSRSVFFQHLYAMVANKHNNVPRDFLVKIWLKCVHLNHVFAQRQSLVMLLINMTGEDVPYRGVQFSHLILPRLRGWLSFRKVDIECFKAVRFHKVKKAFITNYRAKWGRKNDFAQLRGIRRHVF